MSESDSPTVDAETASVINRMQRGEIPLWPVWNAVREALQSAATSIEWCVDLRPFGVDRTVTAERLTLGEQVSIIEATGVGWEVFNPINDPRHALALLEACGVADAESVTTEQFDAAYSTEEQRPADPS